MRCLANASTVFLSYCSFQWRLYRLALLRRFLATGGEHTLLPGAGCVQSVRGRDGQLFAAHQRVGGGAGGHLRKPRRVCRSRQRTVHDERVEVLDVQPGDRRLYHGRVPAGHCDGRPTHDGLVL